MTFGLEHDEHILAGARRLVIEQIDEALEALSRPPEQIDAAVHAARRSLKRVRALLELVRDDVGKAGYTRERECMRDVGKALGAARDATVLVETLELLAPVFSGQLTPSAFRRVRGALAESRDALIKRLVDEERVLRRASEALVLSRGRISAWSRPDDGFGPVRRGLERSYRAGQRGLRCVERDPSPENFHDWRKPTKTHYLQLQFVAPMWPGLVGALAHECRLLSDILNESHDLALLRRRLLEPDAVAMPRDTEAIVALVDERCRELEADALRLGALLYSEKPVALADRLATYWRAWKSVRGTQTRSAA